MYFRQCKLCGDECESVECICILGVSCVIIYNMITLEILRERALF